jgi:hypothetical protein
MNSLSTITAPSDESFEKQFKKDDKIIKKIAYDFKADNFGIYGKVFNEISNIDIEEIDVNLDHIINEMSKKENIFDELYAHGNGTNIRVVKIKH